nr:uncharacterized protein LOC117277165 [Nicotiana tomentosiformis]
MNLSYIPPVLQDGEVVMQLLEEDIAEENQKWNRAIILYVVGNTPTIGAIERFIANQWTMKRGMKCLNGPYTMSSRPIIIRPWTEGFDFNVEVLKTKLLWIKFPKLPLNYWSNLALSKIGSGLGKPLYVDACTTVADRVSYARVLIEMDITRPLPGLIKLYDPKGKVIEQVVQYDWKPQYCQTYCQIGHSCRDQKKQNQERGHEREGDELPFQQGNEKQWQLARGKSTSKKNMGSIRDNEVDIGNVFKALVDTAQKIVQLYEAQGAKGQRVEMAEEEALK